MLVSNGFVRRGHEASCWEIYTRQCILYILLIDAMKQDQLVQTTGRNVTVWTDFVFPSSNTAREKSL